MFGKLRERVKSGELDAGDALCFVMESNDVPSQDLVQWLKSFDLEEHRKRSEADTAYQARRAKEKK